MEHEGCAAPWEDSDERTRVSLRRDARNGRGIDRRIGEAGGGAASALERYGRHVIEGGRPRARERGGVLRALPAVRSWLGRRGSHCARDFGGVSAFAKATAPGDDGGDGRKTTTPSSDLRLATVGDAGGLPGGGCLAGVGREARGVRGLVPRRAWRPAARSCPGEAAAGGRAGVCWVAASRNPGFVGCRGR